LARGQQYEVTLQTFEHQEQILRCTIQKLAWRACGGETLGAVGTEVSPAALGPAFPTVAAFGDAGIRDRVMRGDGDDWRCGETDPGPTQAAAEPS